MLGNEPRTWAISLPHTSDSYPGLNGYPGDMWSQNPICTSACCSLRRKIFEKQNIRSRFNSKISWITHVFVITLILNSAEFFKGRKGLFGLLFQDTVRYCGDVKSGTKSPSRENGCNMLSLCLSYFPSSLNSPGLQNQGMVLGLVGFALCTSVDRTETTLHPDLDSP